MRRVGLAVVLCLCLQVLSFGKGLQGTYLEARTCQVYTGPCFANGETGLAGKNAIMSWKIDKGELKGADLSGLTVALIVNASDTLGFEGLDDAKKLKSIVVVDEQANSLQRSALIEFVKSHAKQAARNIAAVQTAKMDMKLDLAELTGELKVGKSIKLKSRKARKGDCICSNESAYYPPLAKLDGFVPGVTIEGGVSARRIGARWSIPDSRSAYLGTFDYQ